MTTLLALDTATEACSVALLHKGEITSFDEEAQRSHTQRILPMIDELLSQSGICLNQVDALVFGRGPGSFTGVRVGTGIVQGLALGADKPVIGISNLEAMAIQAYQQHQANFILSAIDARMNEIYFTALQYQQKDLPRESQKFSAFKPVIEEQVISPENLLDLLAQNNIQNDQWHCVGTGWNAFESLKTAFSQEVKITLPSARFMLPLALPHYLSQNWQQAENIEPVYLRNQVTWKKLPNR